MYGLVWKLIYVIFFIDKILIQLGRYVILECLYLKICNHVIHINAHSCHENYAIISVTRNGLLFKIEEVQM